MTHIPSEHEIETFSGRYVDVSNPSADDITLDDVAHALSNICRYGGHCKSFYSVAEHAVFVSKRLERKGEPLAIQLMGLHHDDAEAFLSDIPRPMKPLLGETYKQMTEAMDAAIIEGLGLYRGVPFDAHAIKTADNWSLFVEARHLLPSGGKLWWDGAQASAAWGLEPLPSRIVTPDYFLGGLMPEQAKTLYLERHAELVSRRRDDALDLEPYGRMGPDQ